MPRKQRFKAPKTWRPMYRVWFPETDPDGDLAEYYGALDEQCAARIYAERNHGPRGWNEVEWPLVFYVQPVQPTATGYTAVGEPVVVSVMRETVPVFIADRPLPLTMKPAHHLVTDGQASCRDPRLPADISSWPKGQEASIAKHANLEAALRKITCGDCKRRGTTLLEGLRSIGATP